jgi:hypothetical protein
MRSTDDGLWSVVLGARVVILLEVAVTFLLWFPLKTQSNSSSGDEQNL